MLVAYFLVLHAHA